MPKHIVLEIWYYIVSKTTSVQTKVNSLKVVYFVATASTLLNYDSLTTFLKFRTETFLLQFRHDFILTDKHFNLLIE